MQFHEPGVFLAFEETEAELKANVVSLGFDLAGLIRRKKLVVDNVYIERSEITETGEYDLEGLFVRLNLAIDSIGAKRVVLDTLEALFAGIPNEAILRAELRRLFRWLKVKGVTAIITAERGREQLTRHGLEEYVSDCVILLDHRVSLAGEFAPQMPCIADFDLIVIHPDIDRVLGAALHDDLVIAGIFHLSAPVTAHVGVAETARERAFAGNRDAARGGCGRAAYRTHAEAYARARIKGVHVSGNFIVNNIGVKTASTDPFAAVFV
jgi:hypothetical protein